MKRPEAREASPAQWISASATAAVRAAAHQGHAAILTDHGEPEGHLPGVWPLRENDLQLTLVDLWLEVITVPGVGVCLGKSTGSHGGILRLLKIPRRSRTG
jgi:hypothetical protein